MTNIITYSIIINSSLKKEGPNKLIETLRKPPRALKVYYLFLAAFFAVWAGTIGGQAPDNTVVGILSVWLGYAFVPVIALAFATESRRPVFTQITLCFIGSMLIMAGWIVGYDSVNESAPTVWYEPIIFVAFAALMVFPMLVFTGIYLGISRLAGHFGLIPTFLRA